MTPEIKTFNTLRGYSEHGQRIACAELSNGHVMFADIDRNIDGVTTIKRHWGDSLEFHVMLCYDRGWYTSGSWSHRDASSQRGAQEALMQRLIAAAKEVK